MEINKINFATSVVRKAQPNFKGEEEGQAVAQQQQKSSNNVITVLSLLAALGAAGVAVYKHKNTKDAVEKAKKEAQKKIEEAENKAKKAAEDAEKKIKEALGKAKQDTKNSTEIQAEHTKIKPENKEPKLEQKNKDIKKTAIPEAKIETKTKTEIKPEEKPEIKPEPKHEVKTENKTNVKQEVKTEPKSEVKPELKSEVKQELPATATEKKPEIKHDMPSSNATSINEPKFSIEEERQSIKFLRKKFRNISKKIKEQKQIQTEKLLVLNKSIDELGKAIEELKNAADNLLNKRRKPEVKPELPATITEKKTKIKPETKPELPAATDKKPEVKPEKQLIKADKPKVITLEGGIKDSKLKKADKNLLKRIEESKNGIIVIPRRTKLSELVQKGKDYILGKISGLKKKFKGKTAWQLELEEDKKRYTKLVEKDKELNKKAEENKKYVAELEKKLDGSIAVVVPKKPTNFEHQELQKEYDKLGIEPERRVHKSVGELKEQIVNAWKKTTRSKVGETERQLDGSIAVAVPKKPTNFEHQELQKEYDKLGIEPERRVHKTREELKEQITDAWNKTTKSKVQGLEEKLDGSISIIVPRKPTHIQHKRLQKEYDKLAIMPDIKEKLMSIWKKQSDADVKALEKKLDGSISVSVPQEPTRREHIDLQKEYSKLAKKRKTKKSKSKARTVSKKVTKTVVDIKDQLMSIWKKQSDADVKALEKKLDGSISVTTSKKPTNFEHQELQKEYDKLGIEPERRVHKSLEELKEQVASAWRKTTKSEVQAIEKRLDGSISVSVSEAPTKLEHQKLQKDYSKLAIKRKTNKSKPKAKTVKKTVRKTVVDVKEKLMSIWKKKTDAEVKALEKKLDGSISVSVPEAPTKLEHQKLQKEYSKLAIKRKIKSKKLSNKSVKLKTVVKSKSDSTTRVVQDEGFKGLNTDVRKTADVDLLIEYNLLKNKVKNRPVADTASLRFLEIQGELTNHRGYRFLADGSIKKMKTPQTKLQSLINRFVSWIKD